MRRVTVGGRSTAVHAEAGTSDARPDVVLVHGAGFDHTVFRYQTRYLAGMGHRVFAVDLPAHGASEGPALESVVEMGEWLGAAIAAFGCDETVLIGHSMGSLAVLEAATSVPTVRGLVLIGTADRMAVHPELLEAAGNEDRHAIDLMLGWMHTGSHRHGGHPSAGTWTAGASRALIERNLSALGGDLRACASHDPVPAAKRLRIPALVISGGTDKMTPMPAAARLAAHMDRSSQVVIPKAGHVALVERSREVNAEIVGFLSELDEAD